MAYNLQSLITILEQILNPEETRWILDDQSKTQLQSLFQKAASIQQILEKSWLTKMGISLESQIRDAAHEAEDIIESYMVDQMLSSSQGVSFAFSTPDLQQVMHQLDSATEQILVKIMQGNKISDGTSSSTRASFSANTSSESVVVGVDADLLLLKDRLTGMQRKLEIIPIVGMGGIGKTTLARKLYTDPLIVSHFQSRAWTIISQDYSVSAILSDLFHCIDEHDKHIDWDNLYKSLYGRRYLIVIDDIWSTSAWDDMRRYFPDNNNGSRVVITTRESDVAKYIADSNTQQHQVQLLSRYESWKLLRQIVFGEEDCPHVLQGIGEKIASDCGGLPLAVNVIGGLLSKVERSEDVWENIGNDVRAAIVEADKGFYNILSLSYNHLPYHLKPCFLYMGAFPEDHEIKASKLVRMWAAEGFIKSSNVDKSLEEEAEDHLKSLVERNLLMVRDYNHKGMPKKRYSMHDLLRDLCISKADEEKFLHLLKNKKNVPDHVTFSNVRRVSVHASYGKESTHYPSLEFMSLARSFIRTNSAMYNILSPAFSMVRLLRLFDLSGINFKEFPREILQLVNLRYLAVRCHSRVPRGISRLLNLQSLIVELTYGNVPSEVLEMLELRHLEITSTILLAPEVYTRKFVETKLHTVSHVELTRSLVKMGFFESIPNIRDLGIYCGDLPSGPIDLSHLCKLETLRWTSHLERNGRHFLPQLRFPCNLKKLTIGCCILSPAVLRSLCALLNLEMLSLDSCIFENDEWELAEGDEFQSLQFLRLTLPSLVRWRADESNFPRLRHLFLKSCFWLEEVPDGIGEIPTLELIELHTCSRSTVASAKEIVEVQQSDYGNYDLQLRIL